MFETKPYTQGPWKINRRMKKFNRIMAGEAQIAIISKEDLPWQQQCNIHVMASVPELYDQLIECYNDLIFREDRLAFTLREIQLKIEKIDKILQKIHGEFPKKKKRSKP